MWRLHGRTEECARPVFGMLQFPSVPLFTRCHVLRTLEPVRNMELHPRGDMVATQNEDTDLLRPTRSEEHTSELQSLMRNSYAVFCLKKKKKNDKRRR